MTGPADVQDVVDRLAGALNHAVLIEDPAHAPLWWSAQGEVDGTRVSSILQREVSVASRAVVARFALRTATEPVQIPAVPAADMWARWCVPIRRENMLLGYLWVLNRDALVTAEDLPQLISCADAAADVLVRSPAVDKSRRRLLARLADGPDEAAARELVASEHLDPSVTVVVERHPRLGGWPLPDSMSAHIGPISVGSATSGPPVPLADLHIAVRRARETMQALLAGAILSRPSWDALGSWRLIIAAPPDITVAEVHPGADVLAHHSNPDLMLTARTVLERGGHAVCAAAELRIHRTTLYYRLDRITALTGIDLKSGADRDDLLMALRLHAYRNAGH